MRKTFLDRAGLFLKPKSLSFFPRAPEFFFQNTGGLKIWSQIFEKMAVFCWKFGQKVPNIAFFGALWANLRKARWKNAMSGTL